MSAAAPSSETTRLEAFSDGVFAIAITLLVIEIKVPSRAETDALGGLWPALGQRWPSYLGYGISFGIIGIMWANHHALFTYIRRTDRLFLLANVLLLATVAFLPFPTAVLAEHLGDRHTRTAATVFYGGTLVGSAVAFNIVWLSAIRGRRLLGATIDEAGVETITRRYRLGPAGYATATVTAFLNVWLSLAIHVALALFFAASEKSGRTRR